MFSKTPNVYSYDITEENIQQIGKNIKAINYKRLVIFSFLTMVLEVLLIVFNDIPALTNQKHGEGIDQAYFLLHGIILMTSLTVLILLKVYNNRRDSYVFDFIAEGTIFIGMTCMAFIGVLDQLVVGQITSYVTMLIICGIAILIKPPKNYIVYSIPHFIFLMLTFKFQQNPNMLVDVAVNSTLYYMCVLVISKIVYDNQVEHMLKNMMLEASNKQLEYLSNYDHLTNLYNRRYFESVIIQEITDNPAYVSRNIIVGIMDIDHFKKVNDAYGHKAGDKVLQEISKRIKKHITGKNSSSRWGGEEFSFVFIDMTREQCHTLVEELRVIIEDMIVEFEKYSIRITSSFGLAKLQGVREQDVSIGFIQADNALYIAKENGRNCIQWTDIQL